MADPRPNRRESLDPMPHCSRCAAHRELVERKAPAPSNASNRSTRPTSSRRPQPCRRRGRRRASDCVPRRAVVECYPVQAGEPAVLVVRIRSGMPSLCSARAARIRGRSSRTVEWCPRVIYRLDGPSNTATAPEATMDGVFCKTRADFVDRRAPSRPPLSDVSGPVNVSPWLAA